MEVETRDEIIDIIKHEEEYLNEEIKEEIVKEEVIKPKSKPKSRAKPKVKITKEPVEPIVVEEAIVEVVEPPKK